MNLHTANNKFWESISDFAKPEGSQNQIIYIDIGDGSFVVNDSDFTVDNNIWSNIGTEIISVNFGDVIPKAQISNNAHIKLCDISADAKSLIGQIYASGMLLVGTTGKVTEVIVNTWGDSSQIDIHNTTGSNIAANTPIYGTLFLMRS